MLNHDKWITNMSIHHYIYSIVRQRTKIGDVDDYKFNIKGIIEESNAIISRYIYINTSSILLSYSNRSISDTTNALVNVWNYADINLMELSNACRRISIALRTNEREHGTMLNIWRGLARTNSLGDTCFNYDSFSL